MDVKQNETKSIIRRGNSQSKQPISSQYICSLDSLFFYHIANSNNNYFQQRENITKLCIIRTTTTHSIHGKLDLLPSILKEKIIRLMAFSHSPIPTLDFDSISIDSVGFVIDAE